MPFLRQSTAQVIRFGPCLDIGDGVTEETALTLAQADMRLSKDGGAYAQKSAAGNATHDSDGHYSTTLSTTDTGTVGELRLNVHQPANMLPVWDRWWVLTQVVYDAMFGSAGVAPLSPTTAGRTLDIAATGEVALDFGSTIGVLTSGQFGVGVFATGTITAAAIAAAALNGKGDWNIGKTGYSLTQVFPTNFADMAIVVTTGLVSVGSLPAIPTDWITPAGILDGAFTAAKFAAASLDGKGDWNIGKTGYSITALPAISANWLTAAGINAGAFTAAKFGAGAITATVLADNAITANKIAAAALTAAKFATNAVDAAAFAADAVQKIVDKFFPKRNTPLSDIPFVMVDSADHIAGKTGLTFSGADIQRRIDSGTFANGTSTVTEDGSGSYQLDASAADLDGTLIQFKLSNTGADDTFLSIKTSG